MMVSAIVRETCYCKVGILTEALILTSMKRRYKILVKRIASIDAALLFTTDSSRISRLQRIKQRTVYRLEVIETLLK